MASGFRFNGATYAGIIRDLTPAAPASIVLRRRYWGLKGETEIRSLPGGRLISFQCLFVGGDASYAALVESTIRPLEEAVATHGDLEVFNDVNNFTRFFPGVTFDGCDWGRGGEDLPRPDVAGTLGAVGNWIIGGTLRFFDLNR